MSKLLAELDFGQLEARIIAMFSRDRIFTKALWENYDVHMEWAEKLAHAYPDRVGGKKNLTDKKIMKDFRGDVKNQFVFPLFFGASLRKSSNELKIPIETLKPVYEEFWRTFEGVKSYQQRMEKEYKNKGYVECLTGRRRRAPLSYNQIINCVDIKTECLSKEGWKSVEQLNEGELIWTKNPATGDLELQPIQKINYELYSGPVRINTGAFNSVSTPNHRWLIDYMGWNKQTKTREYITKFRESKDLAMHTGGDHKIHLTANPWKGAEAKYWTNDEIRLLGWILTDGYYEPKKKRVPDRRFKIFQSQKANPHKVKIIDSLVEKLQLSHTKEVINDNTYVTWHFKNSNFGERIRRVLPDRVLTYDFLLQLTQKQLGLLYENMLLGDGTFTFRSPKEENRVFTNFCAGKKIKADMFSYLCVLLGKPHNIKWHDLSKYNKNNKLYPGMLNIPNMTGIWDITLKRRQFAHSGFKSYWTEWEGFMWCPSVQNGTFIARREGNVFITGNSPIQGTASDIVVDGMDRLSEMEDWVYQPCLNVHDSLVFVIEENELEERAEVIIKEMLGFQADWVNVPLVVEMSIGYKNWADMEAVGTYSSDKWLNYPERPDYA